MLFKYIRKKLSLSSLRYEVSDSDKDTLFEKTNTRIGLWANYIIVFFILLSVLLVGFDTVPEYSNTYWLEIFIADLVISGVFLLEYIYRWKHSGHKKAFPFRFMNLLDFLSFAPFFILLVIYGIGSYTIFSIFRIFRVFRIFELIERIPIVTKLFKGIKKHKIEYLSAIFVIFIVLTVFSTLVYLSEQKWGDAVVFSSIPETFWWALVTMTNTGYGDIVPISIVGKTIAGLLMVLGPILIAILSSITVIIFINSTKMITFGVKKDRKACEKCGIKNDKDSKYCKSCGEKM